MRPRFAPLTRRLCVYTLICVSDGAAPSDVDLSLTRNCHCLAARREARELTRLYEERLRPHGLRATQFSILAALALKGATPITDLADLLGLERTTLTRSADVMEDNGWIEDAPSDDGRERPLRLTDEGRRKVESAYPAWREAQELVERARGDAESPGASPVAEEGR